MGMGFPEIKLRSPQLMALPSHAFYKNACITRPNQGTSPKNVHIRDYFVGIWAYIKGLAGCTELHY